MTVISERVALRTGSYRDSVELMRISAEAERLPGLIAVSVAMATPLNLELLARQGFAIPEGAGPNDLVIALRAESESSLTGAAALVDERLQGGAPRPAGGGSTAPAASLRASVRTHPELNFALVSVPARFAGVETAAALEAGLNVFCFSSGMPLQVERALKLMALDRGLLLLGADCGTAIIDGVGLGFANVVRRGPIGIVASAGTGIQEVACLLDDAGVGISHAIGVGGRDLSHEVGGLMTLRALELLSEDEETEALLVVGKTPDAEVARSLAREAAKLRKPCALALLGVPPPPPSRGHVVHVSTLEEVARWGIETTGGRPSHADRVVAPSTRGTILGLFSGGTLRNEAATTAAACGIEGVDETFLDLGDEAMTDGRPHPMIDFRLRIERLVEAAGDPTIGVVLLDLVLGLGAHPDPALELAPAVECALALRPGRLGVVIGVCGSAGDPQGVTEQSARLRAAGATVVRGAAEAARVAARAVGASEAAR